VDWMHLSQDRYTWLALVNTVMSLWVPQKVRNFLMSWVTISFSRRTLLNGAGWGWSIGRWLVIRNLSGMFLK
jgi:hypothetical protein